MNELMLLLEGCPEHEHSAADERITRFVEPPMQIGGFRNADARTG